MGAVKVRNRTTLADFSAMFRAALYLSGRKGEAEEGGFKVSVRENMGGKVVTVTEGRAGRMKGREGLK